MGKLTPFEGNIYFAGDGRLSIPIIGIAQWKGFQIMNYENFF